MLRTNSNGNKLDYDYSDNGTEFNYNWNTVVALKPLKPKIVG